MPRVGVEDPYKKEPKKDPCACGHDTERKNKWDIFEEDAKWKKVKIKKDAKVSLLFLPYK